MGEGPSARPISSCNLGPIRGCPTVSLSLILPLPRPPLGRFHPEGCQEWHPDGFQLSCLLSILYFYYYSLYSMRSLYIPTRICSESKENHVTLYIFLIVMRIFCQPVRVMVISTFCWHAFNIMFYLLLFVVWKMLILSRGGDQDGMIVNIKECPTNKVRTKGRKKSIIQE